MTERRQSIQQQDSANRHSPYTPSSGGANRINRSNSAQKIIYPSWWG